MGLIFQWEPLPFIFIIWVKPELQHVPEGLDRRRRLECVTECTHYKVSLHRLIWLAVVSDLQKVLGAFLYQLPIYVKLKKMQPDEAVPLDDNSPGTFGWGWVPKGVTWGHDVPTVMGASWNAKTRALGVTSRTVCWKIKCLIISWCKYFYCTYPYDKSQTLRHIV